MNDTTPLSSCNSDLFCFVLLPCLAGREATGSKNLLKMRILLGSRRGRLKFHKTYACASAEGSGVVTLFQAWAEEGLLRKMIKSTPKKGLRSRSPGKWGDED